MTQHMKLADLLVFIGRRIRARLAERGLDQKSLAKKLDLNETQLGLYLNGKRPWKLEVLFGVAKELGVPLIDLVGSRDDVPEFRRAFNSLAVLSRAMPDLPEDIIEGLIKLKDDSVSMNIVRQLIQTRLAEIEPKKKRSAK